MVSTIRKLVNAQLLPSLPYIFEDSTYNYPEKMDDWATTLEAIIRRISQELKPQIAQTIQEMFKIGVAISNFNSNQFKKIVKQSVGVDIFTNEPWMKTQLENFSYQNINLINSLSDDTLEGIREQVLLGVQQGTRFTETAKDIQKRFAISDRRAKLIARDQTTKLNSSLARLRQEEIGVTSYTWQTSDDERVRPTHRANDGKVFKWDKPPKTGHPGTEVNCRCVAIPVMDDFIK